MRSKPASTDSSLASAPTLRRLPDPAANLSFVRVCKALKTPIKRTNRSRGIAAFGATRRQTLRSYRPEEVAQALRLGMLWSTPWLFTYTQPRVPHAIHSYNRGVRHCRKERTRFRIYRKISRFQPIQEKISAKISDFSEDFKISDLARISAEISSDFW